MVVHDYVEAYTTHVVEGKDASSYFNTCPSLFDHYFTYWADRKRFVTEVEASEIARRREIVMRALPGCERQLEAAGLPIDSLSIVLFVGAGTSNGHAYFDGDRFVIWIPVETYSTDLGATVFLPHEIFHALHYQQSPSFYFHNRNEKNHVGRQLITEGIATYLTAHIMGMSDSIALWADYLEQDQIEKWMKECDRRTGEISRYVIEHFHCTESDIGIFRADDPDDIFNYRVGYFLGLNIIRELVKKLKLKPIELLSMERNDCIERSLQLIESLAKS